MKTIQSLIEEKLRSVAAELFANGEAEKLAVPVVVTRATDSRFGDYQTNLAMQLTKTERANPRELAEQIIEKFAVSENNGISEICEPPEIAGAGFINFRLRTDFLENRFLQLANDEKLGVPLTTRPQKIIIDFSSPNVAKPMHVGHIRSTILGDTLARIARFLGHEVITDNHVGDWGTQFGKVIYGWKHFRDDDALETDPIAELVRLYKKVNALSESDETVLKTCRDDLVKLQQGDAENRAIWKQCVALSWQEFKQMYALLDIQFDEHLGESFYNDRLAPLVEKLLAEKIAEISEGATCVFLRDNPALAEKPCLVRKSDGGFLYATTDLATIEYRVEHWKPDAIWYVVGAPQALHFQQIFGVAEKMGVSADLRHIAFGSILGENRKLMKTRSGENVSLRSLLDEAQERARKLVDEKNPELANDEKSAIARSIGIGAVKYAELSQFRMTDYIFSWDKMLSFQGNTAPYLQNASVRIRSIFRKLGEEFQMPQKIAISEPAEIALVKKLFQFGEIVPLVIEDFRPNVLTNYLYELATSFHAFYEHCPVLKSEGATRESRLAVSELTARILKQGLALLGIEVPERM